MRSTFKKIIGVVAITLLAVTGVTAISSPAQAVACVSGTTPSGAMPAVELVSQPQFFTGLGDGYNSNYIGYAIKNGSAAKSNLYVKLENFAGGQVRLATNQPASQPSGPVAANGSVTTFFFATATAVPNVSQTHDVVLFDGNPTLGGTEICRLTTTFTADPANTAAIAASANKVNTITVGNTSGLTLGGTVSVTVRGQTGNISGSSGAISLSPGSSSNFPAAAWRLVSTSIRLNTTAAYASQAGTVTYTNRTFLSNQASNGGYYEAVYTYKAVSTASAAATIVPIQYINSGSLNMKYTGTLPATATLLPIVNNSVTMTKSSNQSGSLTASGGQLVSTSDICYTIDLANGASLEAVVDQVSDVHPSGTSYVAGSAKTATSSPSCSTGTAITPIVQSADHRIVFEGPLTIAGNSHLYISYLIQFPAGLAEGVYNNSATAYISSTTLGASSIASVIVGVPPLYSISFDARDVNVTNPNTLTQTSAGQSLNIGSVTPSRTGYTFGGWEDINGNDYPSSIIPSANMTVYAIWVPVLYKISFDLMGGTGNSADLTQATAGGNVEMYATGVSKTGFAFGGWASTSGGTTALPYTQTPTSNYTVYAIWTPVYTLSYNLIGGSGTSTTQSQSAPNASISTWQDATKSGFVFGGWALTTDTTDVVSDPYTPTQNTTVYAVWLPVYSVSFDALDNTITNPSNVTQATYGGSVNVTVRTVSRTGYTFGGWSLTSGGTTPIGSSYTPTGNITVYAIWTAVVVNNPTPPPFVPPAGPNISPVSGTTIATTPITLDRPANTGATGTACLVDPADYICKQSVTLPGKGTFTLNANGTTTFVAVNGFYGTATVQYRVVDIYGQFDEAPVTVIVLKPAPPVVQPASGTTEATNPITLTPPTSYPAELGKPSLCLVDPADNVCKQQVTLPGKGTFTLNANGTVSFVAAPGFVGTATVQLRATDALGQSSEAPITVIVTKPAAPVVGPAGGTTLINQPITLNPPVTWPPAYGNPDLCLVDPADNVCKQQVTLPGKGTFTLNPDGTVTFVPAKGFIGEATVQLRATDKYGQSSEAPITVRVTDVPGSQNGSTKGETPVVLAPEKPVEPGSDICLIDPNDKQCKTVVTIAGAGTWTQQANGSVKFAPVAGYVGKVMVMQRITKTASLPRLTPYTVVVAKKRGPVTITISGFADGSPVLTAAIKAKINAFLKAYADYKNVTCIGYTEGPTVLATDAALSKKRAINGCAFVKAGLGKKLVVKKISAGQDKVEADSYRRITITLND
mgnify:FL=1